MIKHFVFIRTLKEPVLPFSLKNIYSEVPQMSINLEKHLQHTKHNFLKVRFTYLELRLEVFRPLVDVHDNYSK